MGISAPKIGYSGYVASDTTLQKDTSEYSHDTSTATTKITGTWIEDVATGSKIRIKCDMKYAGVGGAAKVRVYIGGIQIKEFSENNAGYTAQEYDATVSWNRSDAVRITVHRSVNGTGFMKNFELCGDQSPVILD